MKFYAPRTKIFEAYIGNPKDPKEPDAWQPTDITSHGTCKDPEAPIFQRSPTGPWEIFVLGSINNFMLPKRRFLRRKSGPMAPMAPDAQ